MARSTCDRLPALSLITVQLFFVPTGLCYLAATFHVKNDMKSVQDTLVARAAAARGA